MIVRVLSPQREVFSSSEIESLTLPTVDGIITVRHTHEPVIALLDSGELEMKLENGSIENLFISSGVLRVDPESQIELLVELAELPEDIDLSSAEQARENAKKYLEDNRDISSAEFVRLQGIIEKETARINTASRRKSGASRIGVQVERVGE